MSKDIVDPRLTPEREELNKKAYRPPTLIEYGSVAKLTQGGQGTFPDDGGTVATMMMQCL